MSRSRLLMVALGVIVITAYFSIIRREQPTRLVSTPLPTKLPTGTSGPMWFAVPLSDTSTVLTADEAAMINQTVSDFAMLAKRSPTAAKLFDFYRQNAVRGHIRSDGAIVGSEPKRTTTWFVLAAADNPYQPQLGQSVAEAMYTPSTRRMLISRPTGNRVCAGAGFTHELIHAQDHLLYGEQESDAMSDRWLLSEWHAHVITRKVLNEYTRGAWQRAIEAGDRDRSDMRRKYGKSPGTYMMSFIPTDTLYMKAALGSMGPADFGSVGIQYLVDVNTMVNERLARRDSTAFAVFSLNMLRTLYQLTAPVSVTR